jgi:putative copper resistance protein D
MAGLVAIELAVQSPVATFTGSYFQAHVAQHLLLMVVAPPLLALGAPSTLLLQTAARGTKKRWLTVLRSRPFSVLTFPVLVWFFYFGAMFAFFLSPLVNIAMHHMDLMDAFNVAFLLGGCLYWWPMVGLDPNLHWKMGYGARIANLALGVPFEAFLGVAILSQATPIATMYSLQSTHAGGGLLWSATELSTFAGVVPIFLQWIRSDERAGARADARADRAFEAQAIAEQAGEVDVRTPPVAIVVASSETGSTTVDRFRPLFQPGNSAWEAMWKAKAGYVPGRGPAAGGNGRVPKS